MPITQVLLTRALFTRSCSKERAHRQQRHHNSTRTDSGGAPRSLDGLAMNLIILLAVVAVVATIFIVLYNALVKARNQVDNGWSQIDVQLTRRADLIPNLVNTVKGYAAHERETLEAVISARNAGVGASGPREAAAAEGVLTGVLGKLFALAEAYPDLKADANFRALQEELATTENKVSFARSFYNDVTTRYNTKRETFPAVIVAKVAGFGPRELFEADEAARTVPTVEF
jgi:LemA protein